MRVVVATILLAILAAPAGAADVDAAFQDFCAEWMQKLAVREERNVSHIQWVFNPTGVEGDYVGYTREHTCTIDPPSAGAPVGKISYREVRYQRHGASVTEAEQAPAHPIETTEITEIFRYAAGKWVY